MDLKNLYTLVSESKNLLNKIEENPTKISSVIKRLLEIHVTLKGLLLYEMNKKIVGLTARLKRKGTVGQ